MVAFSFITATAAGERQSINMEITDREAGMTDTDEVIRFLNDNSRRKREAVEQARKSKAQAVRDRFERGPEYALLKHFRYVSPEEIRQMKDSIEEQIARIKREEGIADESDIAEDEFVIDCDELIRSGDVFAYEDNNIKNEE